MSESGTGEHVTQIEADALQDRAYARRSGFNCLVINFEKSTEQYFHFRWKKDRYSAIIDGQVHQIFLDQKSAETFANTDSFQSFLLEDDFGFTHNRKDDLQLSDFFVYPPLIVDLASEGKQKTIRGNGVLKYVLDEKCIFLRGVERMGKTSLLKTLYLDILNTTLRIPVYVRGENLSKAAIIPTLGVIWSAVSNQYGTDAVEKFKQLPAWKRVLFLDDSHQTRFNHETFHSLLKELREYFGLVIVTSDDLLPLKEYVSGPTGETTESAFSSRASIKEMPPSGRGQIIDKWLRLGRGEDIDEIEYARELEREQNFLTDLIRRKGLPSLPYLIVGVLQIRQNNKDDSGDPGSFGFLFQRLVIDALSVTKGPRQHIDRKDGILRRFAYRIFNFCLENASINDFEEAVAEYRDQIQIKVDAKSMLGELESARVLKIVDGVVSFRHPYFYHFFLAKHLHDCVNGEHTEEARGFLNEMAQRPLVHSNQLTLIFFLFFNRRDPIIDNLVGLADQIFSDETPSDMISDLKFIDEGLHAPEQARIDENVSVSEERKRRQETEDEMEVSRPDSRELSLQDQYSEDLSTAVRVRFALSRIEMLGQVIRNFSGTLEGPKKTTILRSVFALGLRTLHVLLEGLESIANSFSAHAATISDDKDRKEAQAMVNLIIGMLARLYCDSIFLTISRCVGTSDIEESYEAAALAVGNTAATQLIDIAIKLDHSEGFPLQAVEKLHRRISRDSPMSAAILSDLVQRHTQIFPLHPETLRKIAGILRVSPIELLEQSGSSN